MIFILREKKENESWETEEIKDEQIYFLDHTGKPIPIIISGTGEPYTCDFFAKNYYKKEFKELEELRIKYKKFEEQQKKKKFTPIQENQIMKEFLYNGLSKRAIARKYGCSEGTVRNILKEILAIDEHI